jgi:hypothetical protein
MFENVSPHFPKLSSICFMFENVSPHFPKLSSICFMFENVSPHFPKLSNICFMFLLVKFESYFKVICDKDEQHCF